MSDNDLPSQSQEIAVLKEQLKLAENRLLIMRSRAESSEKAHAELKAFIIEKGPGG